MLFMLTGEAADHDPLEYTVAGLRRLALAPRKVSRLR
jgi:hypothetical protein